MKEQQKPKSGIPLAIIVIVLLLVVVAAWWLYNSKSQTGNTNRAGNSPTPVKTSQIPPNAPPGAQPPHMLGSPTARVTIEEFADFQCASCAAAHPMLNEIKSAYGSQIKFIYRHFPLSMHDKAYDASLAAEAAGMQGKFWDMQNLIFTNQSAWASDPNYKKVFEGYAERIGLNPEKYKTDVGGILAEQRVKSDLERAKALNIQSTPTIFINGVAAPAPATAAMLRDMIDIELQKIAAANQAAPANK